MSRFLHGTEKNKWMGCMMVWLTLLLLWLGGVGRGGRAAPGGVAALQPCSNLRS